MFLEGVGAAREGDKIPEVMDESICPSPESWPVGAIRLGGEGAETLG